MIGVRRLLLMFATLLALSIVVASPAVAVSVRRSWSANLGSYGKAWVRGYTDGTGALATSLIHFAPNIVFTAQVRAGTCRSLGSVLASTSIRSGANGAISVTKGLSLNQMNHVWGSGRSGHIALRIAKPGYPSRCASLTYPVATRITISSYGINLPIIRAPSGYPRCGVAMFLGDLQQPREAGVTYIEGHARKGMFLPLLNASKVNDGAAMIGKYVKVYTNDSYLHTYKIIQVRRHVRSIQSVFAVASERLWIQTSEGPNYTYPKLIIVAQRISSVKTTYAAAHPTPHPYSC